MRHQLLAFKELAEDSKQILDEKAIANQEKTIIEAQVENKDPN